VIKISEYLAGKIKEYLTVREKHVKEKTDMLFLSNKGYASNVENIAQNIITHCKKYNIQISFHAFRRGFASELSNAGAPIDKISKALGHASVAMTSSRYIYINEREMDDVVLSYTKRYENKEPEKVDKSDEINSMMSVVKMLTLEIERLKITL
jgi:integrase